MIILLVLAAAVVGAPIAAAVLVSLASRREDARHSLSGRAPSLLTRAARRLLSVQPRGAARRRTSHVEQMPAVPEPRNPHDEDIAAWLTGPHA
jgi:hypothetical protein